MAPRLTRWALVMAAGSLLTIWLLLPSGTSLFYDFGPPVERVEDPVTARRVAVYDALDRTYGEIGRRWYAAEFERLVDGAIARGRDPVIFTRTIDDSAVRRAVDSHLTFLWGELPTRDPALLTVVSVNGDWRWRLDSLAAARKGKVCLVHLDGTRSDRWIEAQLNWSVGICSLRERFGPPGKAWAGWLDSTRRLPFDLTERPYTGFAADEDAPARPTPAWFNGVTGDWDRWGFWSFQPRVLVSCAGGNHASCRSAFGIGATDTSAFNTGTVDWYTRRGRLDSRGALPGLLYRDLGEAGFTRLWRMDTTLAAGYEMIRGKPIDGLLQPIVYAMVGPRPKDIGLSLLAWVGALIWLGLFGTWAAYRMNDRRIGG